jgi:hypothetical protein
VDVPLHFTERAFALHLLLQRLEGLIDVVIADENLNQGSLSYWSFGARPPNVPWPGAAASEQKEITSRRREPTGLSAARYQKSPRLSTAHAHQSWSRMVR